MMDGEKKALIFSDSHGFDDGMIEAINAFYDIDAVFHAGDIQSDKSVIESRVRCLSYVVRGNCDYDHTLPETVTVRFGKKRIVMCHGHRHYDYGGEASLVYFAKENEGDVVIFGHIHRPVYETAGGILIINPGSISRPRQPDKKCSFAMLTVRDDGEMAVDFYEYHRENPPAKRILPYR